MRRPLFGVVVIVLALMLALAGVAGCATESDDGGDEATNGETGGSAAEAEPFTYAMSGLYKPFNYTEGGELTGFDVEIGEEIARRIDREPAPTTNPWETIIQGLKAEKYDAIIGSMAITEEREEQVDFSDPYYRSGAQIFVAEDNSDIASKDDLAGKKIGVVKASTFKDIAETLTDPDNVVGYDSDVIALQDLTTGRIDAVITDQVVGFSAINEEGLALKDVGEPLYVDEMGIAVREGDDQLLDDINFALESMIADGTYAEISNKWFGRSILGE